MLKEILDQPRDFAQELSNKLNEIQYEFYKGSLQLSHLHSVIYLLGKSLKGENLNYAEIGSHTGNSIVVAGLSNPNLFLHSFDLPGGSWGGSEGASDNLEKSLDTHFKDRNMRRFGDSHSEEIIKAIALEGPYNMFLVDGDHSAEGALADLRVAYNNLEDGGYLVFDDLIHHNYLDGVFRNFVNEVGAKDTYFVYDLSQEEIDANYVIRGVGVLVK